MSERRKKIGREVQPEMVHRDACQSVERRLADTDDFEVIPDKAAAVLTASGGRSDVFVSKESWLWPTLANPILANPLLASPFGQPILASPFLCCCVCCDVCVCVVVVLLLCCCCVTKLAKNGLAKIGLTNIGRAKTTMAKKWIGQNWIGPNWPNQDPFQESLRNPFSGVPNPDTTRHWGGDSAVAGA